MNRKINFKKSTIGFFALLLLLFISTTAVSAEDLPIDPETITRQGTTRQPALTTRNGIDLFTDSAKNVTNAIAEHHVAVRESAREGLFSDSSFQRGFESIDNIHNIVQETRLFSEPMRFNRSTEQQADNAGIPLWSTISVLILAIILGLFIAIRSASRRKERAIDVHHSYGKDKR